MDHASFDPQQDLGNMFCWEITNQCSQTRILAVACQWNQILSNQVQSSGIQHLPSGERIKIDFTNQCIRITEETINLEITVRKSKQCQGIFTKHLISILEPFTPLDSYLLMEEAISITSSLSILFYMHFQTHAIGTAANGSMRLNYWWLEQGKALENTNSQCSCSTMVVPFLQSSRHVIRSCYNRNQKNTSDITTR